MTTRHHSRKPRKRQTNRTSSPGSQDMPSSSRDPMAVSTSLQSIFISPRTPKTPHMFSNGDVDSEEVELSLLNGEETSRAGEGFDDEGEDEVLHPIKHALTPKDKRSMALLIILYLIQGVPIGLALGSVPFLLREHLSYAQLGTFALSSYPYSLKLLWSPIVDSVYFKSIGRRKTWIIPMQLAIGSLMLYMSSKVQHLLEKPGVSLIELTIGFTLLVFLSATQDIAVDGWALTLLSHENLSFASTCQTIGLNTGYFLSFTVFLAFNSEAFAAKWGIPRLTLGAYLGFWGVMCYCVTFWLIFFKKEDKPATADLSIKDVYKTIWTICKLKHIRWLIFIHLFAKIGFATNEAVTHLKMVERGLKREDLALAVLIDFPFQIIIGWFVAGWVRGSKPLRPWLLSFWPRIFFTLLATLIVLWFPRPPLSMGFFVFLVTVTVLSGFPATIQFVGISAFHTRIADPVIGGTYMTLLNTFVNMGGTWPKYFVFRGVDLFTVATCKVQKVGADITIKASECVSEHGKATCKELGGKCITERDGYYVMTGICMAFGVIFLLAVIIPRSLKLQALAVSEWRVKM